MTKDQLKELICSDLYRYAGGVSFRRFLYHFRCSPGFTYTVWMRVCAYLRQNRTHLPSRAAFLVARRMLARYHYKYGIGIHYDTRIGKGFYIGHFGGIFVNPESVIGNNVNLSQGVTIGQTGRGKRAGCPIIGDNVYIGPGAKIIGAIRVGHGVVIGANCVVVKDIPDHTVVASIPGKVISWDGSEGYILNAVGDENPWKQAETK